MKIHNCEQYSDEWWELRAGLLTASKASVLLTPTGRPSTMYRGELGRLVAERLGLQEPDRTNGITTEWMDRGSNLEDEAMRWLAVERDCTLEKVGFISDDSGMIGASPDALLRYENMQSLIPVEIKVPKPSTHIQWLLGNDLPTQHIAQVHFQMAILTAPEALFMSYHPELPPLVIDVKWDDYTEQMVHAIDKFKAEFEEVLHRFSTGEIS